MWSGSTNNLSETKMQPCYLILVFVIVEGSWWPLAMKTRMQQKQGLSRGVGVEIVPLPTRKSMFVMSV